MYGFNVLGINSHREDNHPKSKVDSILEGAPSELNSFKEVADAIKELLDQGSEAIELYLSSQEAKDQIAAAISEAVKSSDFVTSTDLTDYVKTSVLTEYAKRNELPSIPESLPASDVKDWAKADEKPVYTAEEVGALPINTVIPDAQVQSDWEATDGMGVILNKPEIVSLEDVNNLYSLLEERITSLENNPSSGELVSYKGYFTIVPGETTQEWKANLATELTFTELQEDVAEFNSKSDSGMIAVLYNKWIPKFDAYDEGALAWLETETSLSSAFPNGKVIDGKRYILWYNTGATVDENTRFKIILP